MLWQQSRGGSVGLLSTELGVQLGAGSSGTGALHGSAALLLSWQQGCRSALRTTVFGLVL